MSKVLPLIVTDVTSVWQQQKTEDQGGGGGGGRKVDVNNPWPSLSSASKVL